MVNEMVHIELNTKIHVSTNQWNYQYHKYSLQPQQYKKSFFMKEMFTIHMMKLKKTLQANPIVSSNWVYL